jgi:hypothetical protein
VPSLTKDREYYRRLMELRNTKIQIRDQKIYPGFEYEDTVENLEWWRDKLQKLLEKTDE